MNKLGTSLYTVMIAATTFAACSNDGEQPDTIWTGLSGLLILVVLIAIVWHYSKKRSK